MIPHRRLTRISPLLTLSLKVISCGIFAVLATAVTQGHGHGWNFPFVWGGPSFMVAQDSEVFQIAKHLGLFDLERRIPHPAQG